MTLTVESPSTCQYIRFTMMWWMLEKRALKHTHETISHSDWLRLYRILATLSAIWVQLKVLVHLNIYSYYGLYNERSRN